MSFNGGKDCTVLLHLVREIFPEEAHRLTLIYHENEDEFPEVKSFVEDMARR